MSTDPWDFTAFIAPERLAAIERAAPAALAVSLGTPPPVAPEHVTPEPAAPQPGVRPEPAAPRPVVLPAAPRPAARRPLPARLAIPAGLVLTAVGLTGVVAAATAPPRIGPAAAPPAAEHVLVPGPDRDDEPIRRPAARATSAAPPAPTGLRPLGRARPVVVEVDRLGVRAEVVDLGLRPDGSLDVPDDERVSGWYAGGPSPGERGAAVVVGHVDSTDGPAVFHPLLRARIGDRVHVTRSDGSRATFTVYRVTAFPKDAFPTALVYRSPGMELRLVTCSGEFDPATRHYRDNLVVFARRVR